jgi:hypothetical protein
MLHTKESESVTSRAHEPPIARAVEVGGVPYLLPGTAVDLLTSGTGLRGTQAAHMLRKLADAGRVRALRLQPKLRAYAEADVIKARRELLDGTR